MQIDSYSIQIYRSFSADWVYRFTNGTLVLLFRSICNTSDIKYFKLENVIPLPAVYTLPARLNLKKNQDKFTQSFEKIKAATGVEWSLDDASLESVFPHVGTYQNQVGDIFAEVIGYVAQNIEKRLSDEMVKEAFLELTPKAKLVFKFAEKLSTSNYWEYKFEDQSLTVYFKAIANTSDARDFDFEKLL
ncbi:hypothetical protein CYY_007144 [Polysphondylium violaceum]|uniref:Uncharacterized protein n=1 Tax=Polysphondylium violaceum TaxID=133409 RepID=A0A8J4PP27_9MYCE|nr:hypothetical protein CYY_007144 [Polysphondylium violaceum]